MFIFLTKLFHFFYSYAVKDGGQYDGPVGVISGLKVIEEIVKKYGGEINTEVLSLFYFSFLFNFCSFS